MGRRDFFEERKLKRLIYVFGITLVISIIAFIAIFIMYNRKLKEQSSNQLLELSSQSDIVPNEVLEDLQEASGTSDKNISEASNTTKSNTAKKENKNNVTKTPVTSVVENTISNTVQNEIIENAVETPEVEKEIIFMAPVSGEIIKDFAMDTLVYSNTLEEWTTHSGIDIKADKTTIVMAAESGVVESIKTDPRYGVTITMTHSNGFKTIYSNLLTTEFVSEGETVEKGQTIATVGESSSFEIADEAHLHFEIYKDGAVVNPTIYLKDV